MRKLNLSERRDSFKKQEAVQEVSFDEPDERAGQTSVKPADVRPKHKVEWTVTDSQSMEECAVRRVPLVPQIAVQGSESEELEDWQPCSDDEDMEKNKSLSLDSHTEGEGEGKEGPESACIPRMSETAPPTSKDHGSDLKETSKTSPRKSKLKGK